MKKINIVRYDENYKTAFADIWVPWLMSMTGNAPEPEDLLAVGNPESFYINAGGAVFFSLDGEEPVGVVAVKKLSEDVFEFCKLVVQDRARGLGVGRLLVEKCIEFSKEKNSRLLMLQSFKRLEVALEMYKRMGFLNMPAPEEMLVLARTEIVMGLSMKFSMD